jgi:hypothetical protein
MHRRIFALFASFTVTVLVTTIGYQMGVRQANIDSQPAASVAETPLPATGPAIVDQIATR